MLCHEVRELLPIYSAGAATDEERVGVDAHLSSGCGACLRELGEFQAAASLIVEDEPLHAPPPALKLALMKTIASPPPLRETAASVPARRPWRRIAAAAVGLAAVVAAAVFLGRDGGERVAPLIDTDAWRQRVAETERRLGAAGMSLVDLTAETEQGAWLTHLLYDELSGQLHVWTKGGDQVDQPNWAWLVGVDGSVIADCRLVGTPRRRAGLIDMTTLPAVSPKLYLTVETALDPERPSEQIIEVIDVPVR